MPMFWWKVVRNEHSLLEYKHRRFVHGLLRRLTGLDEFRLNNEHNHGSENGNEYSAYKRLGEWDICILTTFSRPHEVLEPICQRGSNHLTRGMTMASLVDKNIELNCQKHYLQPGAPSTVGTRHGKRNTNIGPSRAHQSAPVR